MARNIACSLSRLASIVLLLATSWPGLAATSESSDVFRQVEVSIQRNDFVQASSLLAGLSAKLRALGLPYIAGVKHRELTDAGRSNLDTLGLVREAQRRWVLAEKQPELGWGDVLDALHTAMASSNQREASLAPAIRRQQAEERYRANPTIILLRQVTRRAYEAGDLVATRHYLQLEREEIPKRYPAELAALLLHELETFLGVMELDAGNQAAALRHLVASGEQFRHVGSFPLHPPRMILAKRLLETGEIDTVLSFLEICASKDWPGRKETPEYYLHLVRKAIREGKKPVFDPGMLRLYIQ